MEYSEDENKISETGANYIFDRQIHELVKREDG